MCPIRTEASDEERLGLVMKNINYEARGVITEDELEGKQIDLEYLAVNACRRARAEQTCENTKD